MKIVLVDDHPLFREGLKVLFAEHDTTMEIVGEASTAKAAVDVVQAEAPDLILMDLLLPGASGITATTELRRLKVRAPIVFLSAVHDPTFVVDALAAGARGYALKEESLDELVRAIDFVLKGGLYLAPGLEDAIAPHRAGTGTVVGAFEKLSPREREVFALAVTGHSNVRIAAELFISVKTVETHRSRINQKLLVHSTGELIRFAARRGLLPS